MTQDSPEAETSGGIDRRSMMAAVGGTAVAAALSGCSTLLSNSESTNCGGGDVPDENIKAGLQTFTEGAAAVLGLQAQYVTFSLVDELLAVLVVRIGFGDECTP